MAERTEISRAQNNSRTFGFNCRCIVIMKRIQLEGLVFAGEGGGKKFLELPWVKRQITEKLGFTPYPGTLNLKLVGESRKRRKLLGKTPAEKICPAKDYCSGALFKAFIDILECGIVIPDVPDYPNDLLEVISSVNLRKTLLLKDGDKVTITVSL
ncbi:CTP-dependent riboflavin kinase [Candidatus Bathyarchaeota archaeon]|jgi:riboflavin kinase|nr:CTP-dependent riboflavin kinase [Candidatus Bathyarchaeota archaeon]